VCMYTVLADPTIEPMLTRARYFVLFFNGVLVFISLHKVVQAVLGLQRCSSACWTAELLNPFEGLHG